MGVIPATSAAAPAMALKRARTRARSPKNVRVMDFPPWSGPCRNERTNGSRGQRTRQGGVNLEKRPANGGSRLSPAGNGYRSCKAPRDALTSLPRSRSYEPGPSIDPSTVTTCQSRLCKETSYVGTESGDLVHPRRTSQGRPDQGRRGDQALDAGRSAAL